MRRAVVLALCLLVPIGAAQVSAATAAPSEAGSSGRVLEQPEHGQAAIQALGNRLPEVAAANQTTAAELRERLAHDDALWVDVHGRLFYVDPAPDGAEPSGEPPSVTSPAGVDTFALHSLSGAARTIYLDFDGAGVGYDEPIGGAWSSGYTGGDGTAEPYNTEGAARTADGAADFSANELAEIRSIWQRVAEDYAPFAVDVTTQRPAYEAINRSDPGDSAYGTRVVLTSSATNCGCGGVAYVGVFDHYGTGTSSHAHYQPAFVYNTGAKAAAEAASHEAGHNLGLNHDGTRSTGYYRGHGDWAPIMGVGYYEPISQWSKGEYSGANNKEDDFAVARANGAGSRIDEDPTGASLTIGTPVDAVIGSAADTDTFSFTLEGPAAVAFAVVPADVSPNLDIRATLRTLAGEVLAEVNPLSSAADATTMDKAVGLDARLTAELTAGTYRLTIDGVGARDPLSTGYSDYGSVGNYRITSALGEGGGVDTDPTPPPAPTSVSAALEGKQVRVSWGYSPNSGVTFQLERFSSQSATPVPIATVAGSSASTYSYLDNPGAGTWHYGVRAVSGSVPSSQATSSPVTVTAKGGRK